MIKSNLPIYLASKSPRRKKMLKVLGINFKTISAEIDETIQKEKSPQNNVKRLALEKCLKAKLKIRNGIIISADTIVVFEKEIIGKPKSKKNAFEILKKLSGNKHFVYTGFAIYNTKTDKLINDFEKTAVSFNSLTDEMIKNYIDSGSPLDKAGAYGIQDDFGSVFVRKINGCYYNVTGFPVSKIYKAINLII